MRTIRREWEIEAMPMPPDCLMSPECRALSAESLSHGWLLSIICPQFEWLTNGALSFWIEFLRQVVGTLIFEIGYMQGENRVV